MSQLGKDAFFSLTQAEYAIQGGSRFKDKVVEGNMVARVRVGAGVDNVAGVKLPVFTRIDTGAAVTNSSLGLVGGGSKILHSTAKFTSLLNDLIKLASLQTSFLTLDAALKVTNRRVNALENVTIPRIENILDYIGRELDELEREDFTRLKKVQKSKEEAIKEKMKAAEAEAAKAAKEARKGGGGGAGAGDPFGGMSNMKADLPPAPAAKGRAGSEDPFGDIPAAASAPEPPGSAGKGGKKKGGKDKKKDEDAVEAMAGTPGGDGDVFF